MSHGLNLCRDRGDAMDYYQTLPVPEPAPVVPRRHDPLAVALGNASLLGLGYLMLRRRLLFVLTALVTILLLVLLGAVSRSGWFEFVVLAWWLTMIAHGFFLARRAERVVSGRQRLVGLSATVAVVLAVGLLRYDATGIEQTVAEAKQRGDCAQAMSALDRVWLGHHLADAPLTVRGELTVDACRRIQLATGRLTTALRGDVKELTQGYDGLTSVLTDLPGHENMVRELVSGFLGGLPAKEPCQTVAITDWLRQRKPAGNVLDRSTEVVGRTAPAALTGCADGFMNAKDWEKARTLFQQLLEQYPGHELTGKAQDGARKATLEIELANVRNLLRGSNPAYCTRPAPYSGAAPYAKGTNRAMMFGNDAFTGRLPGEWKVGDAAEAVLVVCAGAKEYGAAVRTCPYQKRTPPQYRTDVTFHKIAIPVKAYELRTGKLVVDQKVEITGSVCPRTIEYRSYLTDLGPPSKFYVSESDKEVQAAFGWFINQ
ncbi:hypothetical protein MZC58_40925 [Crossiella sp. S99.1]|nr:hypothetical protein [Crossiella sp. S99.1]